MILHVKYNNLLLINQTLITKTNSQGASRGKWFNKWPQNKILLLYSWHSSGDTCFQNRFLLSYNERRFGLLYFLLKRYQKHNSKKKMSLKIYNKNNNIFNKLLPKSVVSNILFTYILSDKLKKKINLYKPEIVFAVINEINTIDLVLKIHKFIKKPVFILFEDNWQEYDSINNLMWRKILKIIANIKIKKLLSISKKLYCISWYMKEDYEKKYKAKFDVLPLCVNRNKKNIINNNIIERRIVYCGSLINRQISMYKFINAIRSINDENVYYFKISIYSNDYDIQFKNTIDKEYKFVSICKIPSSDEKIQEILTSSTYLLVLEDFNYKYSKYTKYSISSKIPNYLISKRPIIVFAPANSGISKYAKEYLWGYILNEQDENFIKARLLELFNNASLQEELVKNAEKTFTINHDCNKIVDRFYKELCNT